MIQPFGNKKLDLNIVGNVNVLQGNLSVANNINVGKNMTVHGIVGIGRAEQDCNHTLDVNGNIGIKADGYLNFGDTTGTSGYGFRDNNGTIELKNTSGPVNIWDPIATLSAGIWSKNGIKFFM